MMITLMLCLATCPCLANHEPANHCPPISRLLRIAPSSPVPEHRRLSVMSKSRFELPPTLNFHIFPRCNYDCKFCFVKNLPRRRLPLDQVVRILRQFKMAGGRRVRYAGGEPTLHPQLLEILELTCRVGLVSSLVTHARRIDEDWIERFLPHLRILTISVDSDSDSTENRLGRRLKSVEGGHVSQVERVCAMVHVWNLRRPRSRRVSLTFNMVITAVNAHETPVELIRRCRPEKVKLLQFLRVDGENDAVAAELECPDTAFQAYHDRLHVLERDGIAVVAEISDDMDRSYAMLDSMGQFFQTRDGRYVLSEPVLDVGIEKAFAQVGGCDHEKFVHRGADYDPGDVPNGNAPYCIAIEGLDGSGKSTIVRLLADRMGAAIVTNPPVSLLAERGAIGAKSEDDKRAWYLAANAAAMDEVERHRRLGRPVVMDRSAASTVAFASAWLGKAARPQDWPPDVKRPDLLLLLHVSEDVRVTRLYGRVTPETDEETRLRLDDAFRNRVLEGYAALGTKMLSAEVEPAVIVEGIMRLVREGETDRG